MPFKKISITSKEAEKATHSVPAYCKHCIFIDEDSTLGQPYVFSNVSYCFLELDSILIFILEFI